MKRSRPLAVLALILGLMAGATGLHPVPAQAIYPPPSSAIGDFSIVDVAPSPNYASDSTIFALAHYPSGCLEGCPTLFRSTDKGATWTQLSTTHLFPEGKLLIAPGYPTDNRIYVASGFGLQLSTDGGATFSTVSGPSLGASMSPDFSAGDQRILTGRPRVWVYDAALGVSRPYDKVIPADTTAFETAFAPDHATSGKVFVGGTRFAAAPLTFNYSAVYLCSAGPVCTEQAVLNPATNTPPRFAFSPDFATNGLMYAWTVSRLYKSTDGGLTFTDLTSSLPSVAEVRDIALDADDDLYMASRPTSGPGTINKSTDDGATWTDIAAGTSFSTFTPSPPFIRVLSDGRLFTTFHSIGAGIQCSVDDGATWATSC